VTVIPDKLKKSQAEFQICSALWKCAFKYCFRSVRLNWEYTSCQHGIRASKLHMLANLLCWDISPDWPTAVKLYNLSVINHFRVMTHWLLLFQCCGNPNNEIDSVSPLHPISATNIHPHSFIQTISIAPFQVHFYSETLPTQHGYCAGVSRRSTTGNCELRTCPRFLRSG